MFHSVRNFYADFKARHRQDKAIEEFQNDMLHMSIFLVLTLLAGCIASLGLLRGNQAIVIGAMIIAPLMTPFVGIALSMVTRKKQLLFKSLMRVISGVIAFWSISFVMGFLFRDIHTSDSLIASVPIGVPEVLIALFAGAVGAMALASQKIYNRISGVAITLSLAPPLSVSGVSLAFGGIETFQNALLLFGINAGGLMIMSFIEFLIFGFHKEEEKENNKNHL